MKKITSALAVSASLATLALSAEETPKSFWPNGARLVISISMQFETGGEAEGAESPFSETPLPKGVPDLPAASWYRYGAVEGIPRMLDLWDKYNIKVTSHVVGQAAQKYPELAKMIAARGHEIAGHGIRWDNQWNLSYDDEKKFVGDGVDVVAGITGQRAVGYNCNWLRRSPNTLKILQDLNFLYHIDDLSHDEPFAVMVRGQKFMVIPYTLRNNDIVCIEGKKWSPDQFLAQLKFDFDRLYEEAATQRRMMSVSLHDRIGGSPAVVKAVEEFIKYAQSHPGVVFMRKDDIARLVQNDPDTPIDNSEENYNQGE